MTQLKKITAIILCMVLVMACPVCAFAKQTKTIFNSSTYTHQDKMSGKVIHEGVDLSKHNGNVNFQKLKNAGVKFVILRAGYRGYSNEGKVKKDPKFDEYIKAAAAQGLDIGVYFYSQAITNAEAEYEAEYTVNVINSYRNYITLPVAFDYEFADVSEGRFDSAWRNKKLNKSKCTNIAKAFCEKVKESGYDSMIYANKSFLESVIDGKELGNTYPIWLAHYSKSTNYSGDFYIWQFSSTGKIDGVNGNVDANFLYEGFRVMNIPDQAHTGKYITPRLNVSFGSQTLVEGRDYYVTYKNNINYGQASAVVTGLGEYENVRSLTSHFDIVPSKASKAVLTKRKINSLSLKWNRHSEADGYRISCIDGAALRTLGTTKNTNITLNNLSSSKVYGIVIQAYKKVGSTEYFGIPSDVLYTCTKPSKVKDVKVKSRSNSYIKLSWEKQSGVGGYVIYKCNPGENKFKVCATVYGANKNSLKVTGLNANKKYKFKVKAFMVNEKKKTMYSPASRVCSGYTAPSVPKLTSAKAKRKKITVKHSKVSGASGYQVKWSTSKNFKKNSKSKNFSGKNNVKNTVSSKKAGKVYYVKVRSYKTRNGVKLYSSWSNVRTVESK